MAETNLGRVQGGGFFYSSASENTVVNKTTLTPNNIPALLGDHILFNTGKVYKITKVDSTNVNCVYETSIKGPQGDKGDTPDISNKADISQVPNPNLLINPNFKINQRGKTEYNSLIEYTVDRWKNSGTQAKVNADGTISIVKISGWNYFYQPIENYEMLQGKTVTFTVKIKNISYTTGIPMIHIRDSEAGKGVKITGAGTYSVTYKVSPNATELNCRALYNNTNIASDIQATIEWAKLEIGDVATKFEEPEPITELAKCKRYYQKLLCKDGYNNIGTAIKDVAFGGRFIVPLYFDNEMYRVPTITSHGNFRVMTPAKTYTVSQISSTQTTNKLIGIKVNVNEQITTDAGLFSANNDATAYIAFDAEL